MADVTSSVRIDFRLIAELVHDGARVLDVGCGDGDLLAYLAATCHVDGRGIEISQAGVNACVKRGLSVIQGDADRDLGYYPDHAFDYAILSQTIQATHAPKTVLTELLRIGTKAIISFPNFGYWDVRRRLLFGGRMPVNAKLPYSWHDTPNIHFCTIRDFVALCDEIGAHVEKAVAIDGAGKRVPFNMPWSWWNLFGEQAVFLLSKKG
ncbi:methionine biosynthesis protein MetW [Hartmannibacter diazotrophicus]|uniref:Methionine biosynthesis protein MetW n=1 Tax=Hartmannibacter diazotrophicus TaxID=1482074 RepID=A0A2C9DDR5_9HYPH|nr:methionine biosynthesis protein MetW [Hartmannibacter diazotrophicus]SON57901.1 methionine biosynthesis protein MetW [Hartmannibacter diazotrophicus]